MPLGIINDFDDDAHFCIKCHSTILGLDNYINHRKQECRTEVASKTEFQNQLMHSDESFNLKADDFFNSLELQSSAKKAINQGSGKTGGILTRSKKTAAIQANTTKDSSDSLQSKTEKTSCIKNQQLKELDARSTHSKLIRQIENDEGHKEEPNRLVLYDESEEESEGFESEIDFSSDDENQDAPPKNHTGGKWKPSSPIQWSRDWNTPPANYTGGKWKPTLGKRLSSPPPSHSKGKWNTSFIASKNEGNTPPATFTGGKWVQSRKPDFIDTTTPDCRKVNTKSKNEHEGFCNDTSDISSSNQLKEKGNHKLEHNKYAFLTLNPNKSSDPKENVYLKENLQSRLLDPNCKILNKSKISKNYNLIPQTYPKEHWKPETESDYIFAPAKANCKTNIMSEPSPHYTRGKWIPATIPKKENIINITDDSPLRKSSGTVQYWCSPCNRRLASKIVYERHLKSELHFKRTLQDRDFDDVSNFIIKDTRRNKRKLPEEIFNNERETKPTETVKIRNRKKIYDRCGVCHSKVNLKLIGKHLISHYHCSKGNLQSERSRKLVLDNIDSIILHSPFQCALCKYYFNTHAEFLKHWRSDIHIANDNTFKGYYICSFCKYQSEGTDHMHNHLMSNEHNEVVAVINRSVPIVIKKIRPIKCEICNETFVLNMQLLRHCKEVNHASPVLNKLRSNYNCDSCRKVFLSNKALSKHKQKSHKEKYFICSPCNAVFSDAGTAKRHRSTVEHKYSILSKGSQSSVQPKTEKMCKYCPEICENFLKFKEHVIGAHALYCSKCPHCAALFALPQDLSVHLRSKSCKIESSADNTLVCDDCRFSSNSESELLYHKALHGEPLIIPRAEKEHETRKKPIVQYKCVFCKRFFPKSSLLGHLRIHTNERPYSCEFCKAGFARKNNWLFHMKIHNKKDSVKQKKVETGERPFLCSTCGANFKKKGILQQHMKIHTGKLCKCPEIGCVYTARKMSELKQHFASHSEVKKFVCSICDYKGKTKQQLNRHISIHSEVKKYTCPKCPFTARLSSHLKRHMRLHTGSKPYSCPHCSYRSTSSENLRKHILSTSKHPGKYIYECKFCREDHFRTNFAKELKAHLITQHSEIFENSTEAGTYVTGIFGESHDIIESNSVKSTSRGTYLCGAASERNIELKTKKFSITTETKNQTLENRAENEIYQMLVLTRREAETVESERDNWNLAERYDTEESSTLVPFQSDSETFFQDVIP